MLEVILKLIIPAIVFWAVGAVMRKYAVGRQVGVNESERAFIWPSLACYGSIGLATVAFGMFAWTQSGRSIEPSASVFMFIMFSAIGFATFLRAHPAYKVTWDSTDVEGPGSYLWPSRKCMPWGAIQTLQRQPSGYWLIKDNSGKAIVWTELYCGWPALVATLVVARPDLFPPEDLEAWYEVLEDADNEQ